MPLFLSAKAPKQNIFAIDSSALSAITLGPGRAPYAGLGYMGMLSKSSKIGGNGWATGAV